MAVASLAANLARRSPGIAMAAMMPMKKMLKSSSPMITTMMTAPGADCAAATCARSSGVSVSGARPENKSLTPGLLR